MAAVVLAGGVGKRMEADRYDACMINDTPRPKQFEATSTILVRRRIHDLQIYNCFHPPTHSPFRTPVPFRGQTNSNSK